ncbi:MAG: hypothetical protein JJE30_01585 [Desulfuromonadales bacterium]|nr:hypothetical protein [Desulfuromonadales bacterium]
MNTQILGVDSRHMNLEACLRSVQAMEMPVELLVLLSSGNVNVSIGELAVKLDIPRKQVLLMLVTLECHGMVRWDDNVRHYLPDSKAMTPLYQAMLSAWENHCTQFETASAETEQMPSKRRGVDRTMKKYNQIDPISCLSQRSRA